MHVTFVSKLTSYELHLLYHPVTGELEVTLHRNVSQALPIRDNFEIES